MNDFERLTKMSDEEVASIWQAIIDLDGPERAELDVEWIENVCAEMDARDLPTMIPKS